MLSRLKALLQHVAVLLDKRLVVSVRPYCREVDFGISQGDFRPLHTVDSETSQVLWLQCDRLQAHMLIDQYGVVTLFDTTVEMFEDDRGAIQSVCRLTSKFGLPLDFPFHRSWSARSLARKIGRILSGGVTLRERNYAQSVWLLGTSNSKNYYHFWTEVVADWLLFQRSGIDVGSVDRFIVPGFGSHWQQEVLSSLGVPVQKIVWSPQHAVDCGVLNYIQRPKGSAAVIPEWLPAMLADTAPMQLLTKSHSHRRLLILRSDAAFRRLLNAHVLIDRLHSWGFEVVSLSGMTVQEQQGLFHSAEMIVAEHGAALTNILWCAPACFVLDIHAVYEAVPCFELMSRGLPVHYSAIHGAAETVNEHMDWQLSNAALDTIVNTVHSWAAQLEDVTS